MVMAQAPQQPHLRIEIAGASCPLLFWLLRAAQVASTVAHLSVCCSGHMHHHLHTQCMAHALVLNNPGSAGEVCWGDGGDDAAGTRADQD